MTYGRIYEEDVESLIISATNAIEDGSILKLSIIEQKEQLEVVKIIESLEEEKNQLVKLREYLQVNLGAAY